MFAPEWIMHGQIGPRFATIAVVLALTIGVAVAQQPIPYSSLRTSAFWTTATWHPAYAFYEISRRGPTTDSACRQHDGTPTGVPNWVGGQWTMLRQGVTVGQDERRGLILSVGYGVRRWLGGYSLRSCIYPVSR